MYNSTIDGSVSKAYGKVLHLTRFDIWDTLDAVMIPRVISVVFIIT